MAEKNKELNRMIQSVAIYNLHFATTKEQKELLQKILLAMQVVDRKFFVSSELCYEDTALAIGGGQTISQPSTVARALMLAELKKNDSVLEIGAGSGWNACLIAFLVSTGSVISIDRIVSIVKNAERNVENFKKNISKNERIKFSKIKFCIDDIFSKSEIWKRKYDKIIFTAGIDDNETEKAVFGVAENLLKKGGILVCPYSAGPMLVLRKNKKTGKIEITKTSEEYVFVPLLKGIE